MQIVPDPSVPSSAQFDPREDDRDAAPKRGHINAAGLLLFALLVLPWSAWAQETSFAEHSVIVEDGTQRSFVIHIPPRLPPLAPVVLVFHGAGGRPQAIASKTGMNELADANGFIVVYPVGAARDSDRQGAWNVGRSKSLRPSDSVTFVATDDVAFVRAVLRDVERLAPVDPTRIYATGLSMGGVFTYRLACEMSETFAAIAPVAATMVEPSCRPGSPVAILHIHGADDDRIPLAGRRGVNRSWPPPQDGISTWSRLDHCAGEPSHSVDAPTSCTTYNHCQATVEYCVVSGEGHAWPQDASERIWAFFLANPKQPD